MSLIISRSKLIKIFLLFIAFFIFFMFLMEYRAKHELSKARDFVAAKDDFKAMHFYFYALNWYFPFGSFDDIAEEYFQFGERLLEENKIDLAFNSFNRLRGAIYATRSFYQPSEDLLAKVNPIIVEMLLKRKFSNEEDQEKIDKQRLIYLDLYTKSPGPNHLWAFIASISFIGWIFFGGRFIYKYFTNTGDLTIRKKLKNSLPYILSFILFYSTWVLGLFYT